MFEIIRIIYKVEEYPSYRFFAEMSGITVPKPLEFSNTIAGYNFTQPEHHIWAKDIGIDIHNVGIRVEPMEESLGAIYQYWIEFSNKEDAVLFKLKWM